jgi:hypothetical protein
MICESLPAVAVSVGTAGVGACIPSGQLEAIAILVRFEFFNRFDLAGGDGCRNIGCEAMLLINSTDNANGIHGVSL